MCLPINKEELLLYIVNKMQIAQQLGWILLAIGIVCIIIGIIFYAINNMGIVYMILIPAGIAIFVLSVILLATSSNMLDLIKINPDYAILKYLEDY